MLRNRFSHDVEPLEPRRLLSTVSFEQPQRYTVGDDAQSVAVADLGNGHPDVVVSFGGYYGEGDTIVGAGVGVLLGNGDGTFAPMTTWAAGSSTGAVAVADLGNGHPDIVVTNNAGNTVTVLLGNGDGTFAAPQSYVVGNDPVAVAIADLGNGHPDLIVANEGGDSVSVLLGHGDGTFAAQTTFATGGSPDAVATADLGNGHVDLAVANSANANVSVLLGNGDGTFQPQTTFPTGRDPDSIAIADLGNGHPDVIVANQGADTVSVLPGNGDGTLGGQAVYPVGLNPAAVAVADLGDGHPDLVVANNYLSTRGTQYTLSVLPGVGDGTFGTQKVFEGDGGVALAAADLGRGSTDLVVCESNQVAVLLNAPSTHNQLVMSAVSGDPSNGGEITVTIGDANGNRVEDDDSTVTLAIASGPANATLGINPSQTASAGSTVFVLSSIDVAGTYTVTATDGDDTPATSVPFTISANGTSAFTPTLGSSTLPASGVAGSAIAGSVTVGIRNASNAAASDDLDVAIYASLNPTDDSDAVLLNDATANLDLASNGTSNVTVPITAVPPGLNGTYTLFARVADTSRGLSTSSPGPTLAVTPSTKLSFTAVPVNAVAAQVITPPVTVTEEDLDGTPLTTGTGDVTLSINGGTLGGTLTEPLFDGVATFSDLTIAAAGTYTLTATDAADLPGTSAPFAVAKGSPLVPTIAATTLPATNVIGGKTGAVARVTLTNGGTALRGALTSVQLLFSTDGRAADGIPIRTVKVRLSLKAGASRTVQVPFLKLPAVAAGDYRLVARVVNADQTTAQASSAGAFALAEPFVSLVPSAASSVAGAGHVQAVSFVVSNVGNVAAKGSTTISLYGSTGTTVAGAAAVYSRKQALPLPAGRSRVFHIRLSAAKWAHVLTLGTLVVQVVDPAGTSATVALPA
jgi:hypothetical protein